jgi:hypothetical protein
MVSISAAGGVGTSLSTVSTNGSVLSGGLGTAGITLSVPAWLTVASGAGADGYNILAAGSQTALLSGSVKFVDSNGISWGMSNSSDITAAYSQSTHAHPYIASGDSTAYATSVLANTFISSQSTHAHPYVGSGDSTAWQTSVLSGTFAQTGHTHSDLYQSTGAYPLTAAQSGHTHGNVSLSLSNVSGSYSSASNGLTLSLTGPSVAGGGIAYGAAGGGSVSSGTVWVSNSNNIQLGISTISAGSYALTGNAVQGQVDFVDSNGIVFGSSVGTGGSSLSSTITAVFNQGYVLSGNNTAGTTSFSTSGSNLVLSGGNNITLSGNSNNVIIISAANASGGAGAAIVIGGNSTSAGSGYATLSSGSALFAGGDNITLSQNGSGITIVGGAGGGGVAVAGSAASTVTNGTMQFANSNNISFGLSGSTMTASIPVGTVNFSDNSLATWSSSAGAGASSVSTSIYIGSLAAAGGVAVAGSAASTITGGTMQFANGNNISFGLNGSTMTASYSHSLLTGVAGSANSTVGAGVVQFANANGISFGLNGSTMTAAQPSWVTSPISYYEPFPVHSGSSSQNRALSTLYLQPFAPQYALSFNMINQIASATVVSTSCSNRIDFRIAGNSSHTFTAGVSATMANMEDLFLFSRGTGGFSSNINLINSTRNNFSTLYSLTYSHSGVGPAAGSLASGSLWHSFSWAVIYPALTSAQSTSVNANSSVTVWGPGYGTYSPASVGTSISTTYNTTNTTGNYNVASTFANNTRISSYKLIPFFFEQSLTPGEYWLGMRRSSSSATAAGTGNGGVGANNSYTYTINTTQLTGSYQLTHYGRTYSQLSSLGWLGDISRNNMWPQDGHGSFTATYDPTVTYVNNAGQPAGAIALSNIHSLNFSSWMEFRYNNRIGSTA